MTPQKSSLSEYHSQWAGQFYVAAELTRLGYSVAFTLGNAKRTDLMVTSPKDKSFRVEVKTQQTKNFWIIRRHDVEENQYYVLVYIHKSDPPVFYILTGAEIQRLREEYADKMKGGGKYDDNFGGMNWTTPHTHQGRWNVLPP
jgi:protease II